MNTEEFDKEAFYEFLAVFIDWWIEDFMENWHRVLPMSLRSKNDS